MQEIKKRRIVLASLLKPVDDTRMFEKLGTTLASVYEVTIIGQPTKALPDKDSITLTPLPAFDRLNLKRLFAPFYVLRTVMRVRPQLLVIGTAELLPIALVARILCRARIMYDIQENYVQNLLYGTAWPRVVRPLLAWGVRIVEWASSFMISHYLLAEKSYAKELRFIGTKFTIVENKALRTVPTVGQPEPNLKVPNADRPEIRLLFSGTLADTTGVFEAINLSKRLYDADMNIRLHVIGYAAKPDVRIRLEKLAVDHPFIRLDGVDHLVPHHQILQAIERAHFGIISYPQNVSTWSAFPTKLYEYLGHRLPILLTCNPGWVEYCKPYTAAVVFDPGHVVADELLTKMKNDVFYTKDPTEVFWEGEAPKLLSAVSLIPPL